jgi:hypothetical protein
MATGLEDILLSIQHHDSAIRRSAEIQYHQFQESPDYIGIITTYAIDGTRPVHFRQLVIILLNQQIYKDWRVFSQASKETLISFAFHSSYSEVSVIRHVSILLLSRIISRSTAVEGREILLHLSKQLMAPDMFVVTSTLKCLCSIAEEGNYFSTNVTSYYHYYDF